MWSVWDLHIPENKRFFSPRDESRPTGQQSREHQSTSVVSWLADRGPAADGPVQYRPQPDEGVGPLKGCANGQGCVVHTLQYGIVRKACQASV